MKDKSWCVYRAHSLVVPWVGFPAEYQHWQDNCGSQEESDREMVVAGGRWDSDGGGGGGGGGDGGQQKQGQAKGEEEEQREERVG